LASTKEVLPSSPIPYRIDDAANLHRMTYQPKLQHLIEQVTDLPEAARADLLRTLIEMDPRYQDIDRVERDE
jgi:hypothetical protein